MKFSIQAGLTRKPREKPRLFLNGYLAESAPDSDEYPKSKPIEYLYGISWELEVSFNKINDKTIASKIKKKLLQTCKKLFGHLYDIIKTDTITYFLNPEGAETFPDLVSRAKLLLNEMKEKHSNQTVLLVSHGDIGKMIYATYYNLSWKNVLTQFHFGNSELLLLSEDSHSDDHHVFSIEQHNH